ncbi:MAG: hypothetical protein JOZ41_14800, partial [Chloroflexi bacterium]|nr:hypothetical protein [Chloroflexota bacterium]
NVRKTDQSAPYAEDDPWDARTLEWITPNPTPYYNFIETPVVHALDDFWHRKYSEDESGRLVRVADPSAVVERRAGPGDHIHMPSPSYWPLIASLGVPIIGYGQVYRTWGVSVFGALVALVGLSAWALEPSTEPPDPDEEIEAHALEAGVPTRELEAAAAGGGPAGPGAPAESSTGDA